MSIDNVQWQENNFWKLNLSPTLNEYSNRVERSVEESGKLSENSLIP